MTPHGIAHFLHKLLDAPTAGAVDKLNSEFSDEMRVFFDPFVPKIKAMKPDSVDRSSQQNRLLWEWNNQIARHLGDQTPEDVHCFNKLHIGVPILRKDDAFREKYDKFIKPLSYEEKMEYMREGKFYLPVTSVMTVKEMTTFLDGVAAYWAGRGVVLTDERNAA